MKRRILISSICLILFSTAGLGQEIENEVLLTIGNENISRAEFERIYLKNNQMVSEMDKKSLDEYLDLFIIYKLKVAEAKSIGLDKTEAFKKELEGYRKQLVQPYLIDKETEEKLYNEAYERMKYELDASHILIAIPEKATPEDTLILYDKALKIRQRIIDGESFKIVAKATSDDPSVKRNGGRLGYFTAFQMVYPFESVAYETPAGQISMPFRTRFGYHLVKVHNIRPSAGQIKTSHIMIAVPQTAGLEQQNQAKERIDSIYKLVLNNEDFATLARNYSQDPGSARNGGELPYFGLGRMVPEFEKAAFELERDGQVSEPVRTQYGWHIIKRLDKKLVGTYDEVLPEIKNRFSRDERGRISKQAFIKQLKSNYGFSMDSSSLKTMEDLLDETYYAGTWEIPLNRKLDQTLFQFAGQQHSLRKLAEKIKGKSKSSNQIPFSVLVERNYNELVEETLLSYEEERLVKENSEFYFLMKEYYDGILLFEIMDQSVWSKAANDAEGLKEFYDDHVDNYRWEMRIHTQKFISTTEATAKKVYKLASSKKGTQLAKDDFENRFNQNGEQVVNIVDFAALPEDSSVKEYKSWKNGISPIVQNEEGYVFYRFDRVEVNEPIPMDEIRGRLIADYQEFLEKRWIENLREKYSMVLNKEIYEQIASSLN